MIGFFVFLGCAVLFYALSIRAAVSKLPVGIWAQDTGRPKVNDVKAYNRAVAIMFAVYGTLLLLAGLPMLLNMSELVVLICGVPCIALGSIGMFIAGIKIDEKYRVGRY